MKCLLSVASILILPLRCGAQDVIFHISPETGVSSDRVTVCRVTATNYSGVPLEGRGLGFEASAIENGVVVERERGRFGGILRNGETAETLIGFNGEFHSFEVVSAPVSAHARAAGAGRGRKGAAKPRQTKPGSKKRSSPPKSRKRK